MGLHLVAEPEAERDAAGDADVVLQVPPELGVAVLDQRITAALGVSRRPSSVEVVEAGKRERAAHVAGVVAAVAAGLEQEAGAGRVPADGVIEVGGELEVGALSSAFDLRAAGVERLEHEQRRLVGRRGRERRLVPRLEAGLVEEVAADRAADREAEDVVRRVARVSPLRQIVVADAEVLTVRARALVARAQGARLAQRVIDAGGEVGAIGRPADAAGDVPLRQRRVQRLRVVGVDRVRGQREAGAILDQRAVEGEGSVLLLLGRSARRERIAGVQRLVAEHEVGRAAQRPAARTRMDVDEHHPAAMILRGEEIAAEADRLDLRLRRQAAAAEPVDAERRAGPSHLLQRLLHVVGIVGQRLDLRPRHDVAECVAARIESPVARILADDDVFRDLGDGQLHLAPPARPRAHADVVELLHIEARELCRHRVATGSKAREDGLAAVVRAHLDRRAGRLYR